MSSSRTSCSAFALYLIAMHCIAELTRQRGADGTDGTNGGGGGGGGGEVDVVSVTSDKLGRGADYRRRSVVGIVGAVGDVGDVGGV